MYLCTVGRILCIDYGRRRCGLAVTDMLRIVANPTETVATASLFAWIKSYIARECVDRIVVGLPRDMRGRDSQSMTYIKPAVARLRKEVSPMGIDVVMFDERFTSVLAHKAMLDGGVRKSDRRDRAAVDRIAAAVILNDYLQSMQYQHDEKNGTY